MKCFVVSLVLLVVVAAQSPPPPVHAMCDIPNAYSGTLSQTILFDGCKAVETNFGEIYYSYSQQRIRFDILNGETNLGGAATNYSISLWADYTNQIEYILDHSDNTCTSMPLTTHIGSGQLPSDSNFGGTVLIGSQPIHEYWFPVHYQGHTFQYEIGLMSATCLPFNVEIFNATAKNSPPKLVLEETLFNVVPMVPPFVMDIPSACTASLRAPPAEVADKVKKVHQSLELRAQMFGR